LLEAGLPVYPVNPKTVDRHRKPGSRQNRCHRCLSVSTNRTRVASLTAGVCRLRAP
jgi:hypothetical protein